MKIALFLTLTRLFLAPFLLAPLIALRWPGLITCGLYVFLALTDLFDGYFARRGQHSSQLGAFLDQFADKVFLFSVIFATLATQQLPLVMALLLGFRELAVMGMREYSMQKSIHLPVIFSAKLKTVFQMILFGWIIADLASVGFQQVTLFLFLTTLVLSYYSAYWYLKKIIA